MNPGKRGERPWPVSVALILATQTLVAVTFGFAQGFLPYYLARDLGVTDPAWVSAWVGASTATPPLIAVVSTPLWGMVADRVGHKPLLLRTLGGTAVAMLLSGLATEAWQLLLWQALIGVVGGVNAIVIVMTTLLVPRRQVGHALGWVQTARFVGMAAGPGFGGLAGDVLGFRGAYIPAGCIALVVMVVAWIALPNPRPASTSTGGVADTERPTGIGYLVARRDLLPMLAMIFLAQFSFALTTPYLPLRLAELNPAQGNIATLSGLLLSASALSAAVAGIAAAHLAERWGGRRLLVCAAGLAAVLQGTHALATTTEQLFGLRMLLGLPFGVLTPVVNARLALVVPGDRRGLVFGVAASAQLGGNGVGSIVGSVSAITLGLAAPFVAGAFPLGLIAALAGYRRLDAESRQR